VSQPIDACSPGSGGESRSIAGCSKASCSRETFPRSSGMPVLESSTWSACISAGFQNHGRTAAGARRAETGEGSPPASHLWVTGVALLQAAAVEAVLSRSESRWCQPSRARGRRKGAVITSSWATVASGAQPWCTSSHQTAAVGFSAARRLAQSSGQPVTLDGGRKSNPKTAGN
jgi:hypothetical protein